MNTADSSVTVYGTALNCHGCGNGKTLHVLLNNWGTPPDGQRAWEKRVAATFKKMTGAKVSYDTYLDVSQVQTTIDKDAVSQIGPDVFQTANTYVAPAVAAGVFTKMTPQDWAVLGGKDRFLPRGVASDLVGTPSTGPVMVPQWLNDNLLAYNKELFKRAGIAQPPSTWDEYIKDAQKITKLGHGIYGSDFEPLDALPWHLVYLLAKEYGGDFLNAKGTQATMTNPLVTKAVDFWFDFYRKYHIVAPESINWTATQAGAAFAAGKIGMMTLQTSGVLTTVKGQPADGKVAFAPMPSVPYGQTAPTPGVPPISSEVFSWNLGVTSWSSQKALAYRFIRIATDDTSEKMLAKSYSDVPATKSAIAALKNDPTWAAFTRYISQGVAAPESIGWLAVEVGIGNVTATLARDVQNHKYSPGAVKQALAKANEQVQAALHP
jgi:multiple sugar transport system substrate-binding protein